MNTLSITLHAGAEGFWFGDHFIRLVRGFTTEDGTTEEFGFVAGDLARALEHTNSRMLTAPLDPDQKGVSQVYTPGGPQSMTCITESGFYDVVIRSDKPEGKALRGLVTREILPQLRRGGTIVPVQKPPAQPQALTPDGTINLIERSLNILERLEVLDERDKLQFGDMVRSVTARAAGGLLLPALTEEEELTVSDAWLEVTGTRLDRKHYGKVGKTLKREYMQEFNTEPPKRNQHVDGAIRKVCCYKRGWLIEMIQQMHEYVKQHGYSF